MRTALRWIVALSLVAASAGLAYAQAFENAPTATLGVGMMIPTGSMSDFYGPGITGRVSVRMPISQGMSFGVESGIMAPNQKSGSQTLYQYPVRALLYFPLASEASSTPYFALGPGVTFNSVGDDAQSGGSKDQDPTFTYALKIGWAFRPEHMTSTIFELGARYEQQFIGHSPDFQTVELEACVGRTF